MAIPLKKICRDNLNTYVTKLSESKAGLTSKGDYTLDSDVYAPIISLGYSCTKNFKEIVCSPCL